MGSPVQDVELILSPELEQKVHPETQISQVRKVNTMA